MVEGKKATLALNHNDDVVFIYGFSLAIEPEWVSLDVEIGLIQIFDLDGQQQHFFLDKKMDNNIYERVRKKCKILLVEVTDNNIYKAAKVKSAHLMIPQQA